MVTHVSVLGWTEACVYGTREIPRDKAKRKAGSWSGWRTLDFIPRAVGMILSRGVKLAYICKRSLWDVMCRTWVR